MPSRPVFLITTCLVMAVSMVTSWTFFDIHVKQHPASLQVPPPATSRTWAKQTRRQTKDDDERNDDEQPTDALPTNVVPKANYGVSFMGGDPCGSKYNDDPFDATKEKKPGIPDDMKARIAALAEEKKKQAEMKKSQVD